MQLLREHIPISMNKLHLIASNRVGWWRNHRKFRSELEISVKKTAILSEKWGILAGKSGRYTHLISELYPGIVLHVLKSS